MGAYTKKKRTLTFYSCESGGIGILELRSAISAFTCSFSSSRAFNSDVSLMIFFFFGRQAWPILLCLFLKVNNLFLLLVDLVELLPILQKTQ